MNDHRFSTPRVREIPNDSAVPLPPLGARPARDRGGIAVAFQVPQTQRELVAWSLLRCPPSAAGPRAA